LAGPAPAGPACPAAAARRRPLVRAAAQSGGCLVIAFGAMVFGGTVLDPDGPGPHPYRSMASLVFVLVLAAVLAALGFLANGVVTSLEQRRSRRQLPPRPGPDGHALDGGRHGDPVDRGGTAASAMGRFPPAPAPARPPAPSCGLTSRGG